MEEVNTIVLENGIEYFLLDEINIDNNTYYYLVNTNDNKDICIRKKEIENGEEYVATLDSDEEVAKALAYFAHKNKDKVVD